MRILIVHSHPEPKSFNGALTEVAVLTLRAAGHDVVISDLYRDGFSPLEGPEHYPDRLNKDRFSALAEQRHASENASLSREVQREIDRLKWADLVVFQFPLWWHAQPAILKGWFDRVFVSGGLYTSRMRYDRGVFRGKRAICSVTTGAPQEAFGPGARGGDMDQLMWPIHYSLHYMGFSVLPPFLAHGVQGHGYAYQSDDGYGQLLDDLKDDWAARLENLDRSRPLSFAGWNDWTEAGQLAKEQA
ncbi:NAD(P)H-dependent oxidoreductase [Aestuariispira ectoiniformans]|uniref:NAD(P)H-dependent oxidoreductase n=1 Tax=Aestuariispira ectoiniformans TaxID=2775080 RepID=UPI00223A6FA7|nr:NAD(P)H-dependent oxidoreductase [Aestuariispira ectoiniformans]